MSSWWILETLLPILNTILAVYKIANLSLSHCTVKSVNIIDCTSFENSEMSYDIFLILEWSHWTYNQSLRKSRLCEACRPTYAVTNDENPIQYIKIFAKFLPGSIENYSSRVSLSPVLIWKLRLLRKRAQNVVMKGNFLTWRGREKLLSKPSSVEVQTYISTCTLLHNQRAENKQKWRTTYFQVNEKILNFKDERQAPPRPLWSILQTGVYTWKIN